MNLSKSSKFTTDELMHLSIWETPGLFDAHGAINKQQLEEIDQVPSLTVEEVEAMQKQAYEEAYAQGLADGHTAGEAAGHAEGYAAGHATGYNEGLASGQENGYSQGFQEGHQQGHAQGYEEATAIGQHETRELQKQQAAQFASMMDALNEPFKKLDAKVEKQLVDLAIAIATHLVRRELKQDPGEVIAVVRAAVNVLPVAAQNISLHLHPADADLVKSALALTHTITSWNIVENPLITQGGCKVITDVSYVDATVEKRLASVISMVLGGEREEDNGIEEVFEAEVETDVSPAEEEELAALVDAELDPMPAHHLATSASEDEDDS